MNNFRNPLPQLSQQFSQQLFLTDGGIETELIFKSGFELPLFASFPLVEQRAGRDAILRYYQPYLQRANRSQCGFILESPTWRASHDWGQQLGYTDRTLADANRAAISLLADLRCQYQRPTTPIVISGCIGPRGDGYRVAQRMSAAQAQRYHQQQVDTLADTEADMVSAFTIGYVDEAIGICRAAVAAKIPVVISFTTETDGSLPDGTLLSDAIQQVDQATDNAPAYYMINCAHPDHFSDVLDENADWTTRIQGIRANASRLSHAELDEAEELDSGNPEEFGQLYRALRQRFSQLNILGGCCGTDYRHVDSVCHHCHPQHRHSAAA